MKRFAKDIHNTTDYYLIRCLQINRDEEILMDCMIYNNKKLQDLIVINNKILLVVFM